MDSKLEVDLLSSPKIAVVPTMTDRPTNATKICTGQRHVQGKNAVTAGKPWACRNTPVQYECRLTVDRGLRVIP